MRGRLIRPLRAVFAQRPVLPVTVRARRTGASGGSLFGKMKQGGVA